MYQPARVWLYVHGPVLIVQVKCLQGSGFAKVFNLIDVLVASVVAGPRLAFGVLVGKTRAQGFNERHRCELLRCNELEARPAIRDPTVK